MTVLQLVSSHGHKLEFGDVEQAFTNGDKLNRSKPLFVQAPPEGLPGVGPNCIVQLEKTVYGLADGTREWKDCLSNRSAHSAGPGLEDCGIVF